MGSLWVPALTEQAHACFRRLGQMDGAVGPGAKRGRSHPKACAVHDYGSTPNPPPHRGRGGPPEGTAALQSLLQGAGGIKQPGGGCGGGRVRSQQASCFPVCLLQDPAFPLFVINQELQRDFLGLPQWLSGKESACQCRRHGFNCWS